MEHFVNVEDNGGSPPARISSPPAYSSGPSATAAALPYEIYEADGNSQQQQRGPSIRANAHDDETVNPLLFTESAAVIGDKMIPQQRHVIEEVSIYFLREICCE